MLTNPSPPSSSDAAPPAAAGPPADPDGAVRWFDLDGGALQVEQGMAGLRRAAARKDGSLWVDLVEPSAEVVRAVADLLGLHPLIAADIEDRQERPKVALFDDAVHVVVFRLEYHDGCQVDEIDFVLGRRYLLSVHERGWQPEAVESVHREMAKNRAPDFVFWALLDAIVDGYFPAIDQLGDAIDALQDAVVRRPDQQVLSEVFRLKRELLQMRRSVTPARDLLNVLTNRNLPFIAPRHLVYFRDVYDHLIRVTDEIDTDRDLIAGTLDAYLSTVNNNLSLIMKRLTGVTVILAGIGAIAGIFGMSEASNAFSAAEGPGFWAVTGITVGLALVAAAILRRIDWI